MLAIVEFQTKGKLYSQSSINSRAILLYLDRFEWFIHFLNAIGITFARMNFVEKLKQRWEVKSAFDVLIILLVFTCTGFTSLYVKNPIFNTLGIREIEPRFLRGLVYTLAILVFYNILLLVYGFIFGKFKFFFAFEKRFFGRIVSIFKRLR